MSVRESATTTAVARPEDERLSIGNDIIYGLQHILSMFGGVIAVPFIVGGAAKLAPEQIALLVSCSLFISGLATILQTLGVPYFGSQLPLVQGISFASVSTLISIVLSKGGGAAGMQSAYGATIVGGVVALIIVPFFAQVIRFFPPVVTGSVITVIGLSLIPAAGGWIVGNDSKAASFGDPWAIALAVLTLAITLAFSMVKRLARMAILLGLVVGTILSPLFGQFHAPDLSKLNVLALPQPFFFGVPTFDGAAILSMIIVLIVIMVETTADILAVGVVVGTDVDAKRVAAGLRADMLSCIVAPVFNTFPATAFAQNVGLVALSGIKSRYAVATGGAILAVLGLSPWLAGVIGVVQGPVLGGVGIALFGTVAASGIRTLGKVNYDGNNNLLIVAVAMGFGLIPSLVSGFWSHLPAQAAVVLNSGISACAVAAFVLNLVFNVWGKGGKSGVHVTEAHAPAIAVSAKDLKPNDLKPNDLKAKDLKPKDLRRR